LSQPIEKDDFHNLVLRIDRKVDFAVVDSTIPTINASLSNLSKGGGGWRIRIGLALVLKYLE
jgi:hypothetical protein